MQLATHAKEMQAAFNRIAKGEEMAAHEMIGTTNPALEDAVFRLASRVALRFAVLYWSNFHTWEFFRNIHTYEEARQHGIARHFCFAGYTPRGRRASRVR
jgi:hypothetical protein